MAVVGAARDVLVEQPLDRARRGAGRAARRASSSRRSPASVRAARSRNQRASGHAEAGLAALRDLAPAGRPRRLAAARPCRARPLTLSASGSERPSSSTALVEERRAQLERVRHRGDVGLAAAGRPGGRCSMSSSWRPAIPGRGGGPSSCRGRRRARRRTSAPELGAQLGREDLHQAAVALAGRRRGGLEEARGARRRRARLPPERPQRARRERRRPARRSRPASPCAA